MLPPREGFSARACGAIGLQVRLLARPGDLVVGSAVAGATFAGPVFVPAFPAAWPPASSLGRYARAVARALAPHAPSRIEVHNRPVVALALRRRFPGVPVALHLHNDPRAMRGTRSPRARRALARRGIAVATVSAFLARAWDEGGATPPTAAVLPNALALASLPEAPRPPDARDPVILFAGRVVADKGADLFVDAVARVLPACRGWDARMIGADRFSPDGADTPFLAALRPRIRSAGIVADGYRPHDEVLRAMAAAAIVVAPSRWEEPFGLVALEAMACGAALVTTARGGLPEVAGDAALAVPAGDADALADAIALLVRDPARRAILSAAGRRRAAAFDVEAARARLDAFRARTGPGA